MTEKDTTTLQDRLDAELDNLLLSLEEEDTDEQKPVAPVEHTKCVSTPASAPATTPAESSFPPAQAARLSTSLQDALFQLKQACHELALHGNYDSVRNCICQLQIELNDYGLYAPNFRPRPKAARPKGKGTRKEFTDGDMAIHRDLIVIDCHWLFVRNVKVRVDPGDMLYEPLFTREMPFSYELAWKFANETWSNETRVGKALRLPQSVQYQLAALRSRDVANDLERLTVGSRQDGRLLRSPLARVGVALQEWCDDDDRVESQFEVYEAMYQAYWLLGPDSKATALAELTGLIHGSPPLNPRTLRGKLEKLLDRMGQEWSKTGPQSEKYR